MVPRINKKTFCKELQQLVEMVVLNTIQQTQYNTIVFIIAKKEGSVRFITDYHRLNQKLVRKLYLLSIIGNTMKYLKVFQYETASDLNMGYYTIRIFRDSQYMTTIVTEFVKFIYNFILMGMCTAGDIFQAKVDEIIGDIKVIKTYIDHMLVIRN